MRTLSETIEVMVRFDTTSCKCCYDFGAAPFGRTDLLSDRFNRRDKDRLRVGGDGDLREGSFGFFYCRCALRLFLLARAFKGGGEEGHGCGVMASQRGSVEFK
jgi:hypothetical protein